MRFIVVAFVASLVAAPAWSAIIEVPTDAATIAEAAAMAAAGDEIVILAGTYAESGIDLPAAVAVRGATGNRDDVIIDLAGNPSLFLIADATAFAIANLTILNGGGGAGALAVTGTAAPWQITISNCRFADCTSTGAGAALSVHEFMMGGATLHLADSLFERCSGTGQGSVVCLQTYGDVVVDVENIEVRDCGGSPIRLGGETASGTVSGSSFLANTGTGLSVGAGGDGDMTISDCRFDGNVSTGYGGGFVVTNGVRCVLVNCVFTDNSAAYGGGAADVEGRITADHCEFTNNSASSGGGGVHSRMSSLSLTYCSFRGNWGHLGGGAYSEEAGVSAGNCDFIDNNSDVGGAISAFSVYASQATFAGNNANQRGGAVSTFWYVNMNHCDFSGNTAPSGPAVYAEYFSQGTFNCCDVDFDEVYCGFWESFAETYIGCTVATDEQTWDGVKAMYR